MEQAKQFQCPGDCLQCSKGQRLYCACQHTYNSMRMLQQMENILETLNEKMAAIQDNEALVFVPSEKEDISQEGDGEEE